MLSTNEAFREGEKMLVEVFLLLQDRTPTEELVSAIAKSNRWKDLVTLRVNRLEGWESAETPYGKISDNTVVVCGTHVINQPDYWAVTRALEDCEHVPPVA